MHGLHIYVLPLSQVVTKTGARPGSETSNQAEMNEDYLHTYCLLNQVNKIDSVLLLYDVWN